VRTIIRYNPHESSDTAQHVEFGDDLGYMKMTEKRATRVKLIEVSVMNSSEEDPLIDKYGKLELT
jgi:hypothetical protein